MSRARSSGQLEGQRQKKTDKKKDCPTTGELRTPIKLIYLNFYDLPFFGFLIWIQIHREMLDPDSVNTVPVRYPSDPKQCFLNILLLSSLFSLSSNSII